tara:strand:- start:304 stop:477 length:174 start_codon:yes stop_codon:yes gene_type:complete
MKTKIIISKGWNIIKEYDFLITMTNEDLAEFEGIEYRVTRCMLDIENNTMLIILKNE